MSEELNQNTPPTFSKEQQDFLNTLIGERIGKTKAQAEADKAAAIAAAIADKDSEVATLKAALEAAKKGGSPDAALIEAERLQMKNLLEAEKGNTKQSTEQARKNAERADALAAENRRILKGQALREAMDSQDTFTFVDPRIVNQLVDANVHFDEESGAWVVKESGVVRQNNSMQPMSLKEYMAEFAAQHPYLVKGTTKGGSGSGESNRSGSGLGKVSTKLDLKTPKDKSDFITKFGYDAFAKLPAK